MALTANVLLGTMTTNVRQKEMSVPLIHVRMQYDVT